VTEADKAIEADPATAEEVVEPDSTDGGRRRLIAMLIWAAAFALSWVFFGLPATDPLQAYLWLWAASIAWRSRLGWRAHLRFGRDWLPVVLLLEAYNYSRGFADNGVTPHAAELVHADRFLLGWATGGEVPTIWLQQHFYDPHHLYVWDVLASWIYFTHFVAIPTLALVLWLRNRARWSVLMRRWFVLSFLGLATYFVYPAAPPWWASDHGLIGPVVRISTRGWKAIGLHGTGNLLQTGQLGANPIAAMPSLHSAYALLFTLTVLPMIAKRWRWLMLLYPLAMTLTLLYSGEHYLVDVLFGWAYAVVSVIIADAFGRWRDRRRADHDAVAVPEPAAMSV
jgi:hypothetical protein